MHAHTKHTTQATHAAHTRHTTHITHDLNRTNEQAIKDEFNKFEVLCSHCSKKVSLMTDESTERGMADAEKGLRTGYKGRNVVDLHPGHPFNTQKQCQNDKVCLGGKVIEMFCQNDD
jgi:hypothetical protein